MNQHTKFEVSIFILSRHIYGISKFENRSRELAHAPVWSIFLHFWIVLGQSAHQIWSLYHSWYPFLWNKGGAHNYKTRSRDAGQAVFDLLLHFLLVGLALNPRTKSEVSNYVSSRDIQRIPKFENRSRRLVHATTWPNFLHFLYITPCDQFMYEIWSL